MSFTTTTSLIESLRNFHHEDGHNNDPGTELNESTQSESQSLISFESQLRYGYWITIFYCGILILASILYILHKVADRKPQQLASNGPTVWQRGKAAARIWSYRRLKPFGYVIGIPSVGILSIILLSWAYTFGLAFLQRPYYKKSEDEGSPPLGIRAGMMAAALMPLIIALGGKANIITFMTGIGHEKLNVFHRSIGFLMFLVTIIHTFPFLVVHYQKGGLTYMKQVFYTPGAPEYNGTFAFAFISAIVAFSFPYIRRKMYELFYWSHVIFAVVFLALLFWHFDNVGSSWMFLWATVGIWAVQVLGRVLMKSSLISSKGNQFKPWDAVATKMTGGVIRLEVLTSGNIRWTPGQHVFLRLPNLSPFDNHPFTVASIPNHTETSHSNSEQKDEANTMLFLIKPYDGFTRKLATYVENNPDTNLKATIDGPYGTHLRRFDHTSDTLILVAGGVGITAMLPIFSDMSVKLHRRDCTTQQVHLIWMIRHSEAIGWIKPELTSILANAPPNRIKIDFYITNEQQSGQPIPDDVEKIRSDSSSEDSARDESTRVKYHYRGRPQMTQLLPKLVSDGRNAVVGCGPEALKADLSNVCAVLQKRVLSGQMNEISLHTETFNW